MTYEAEMFGESLLSVSGGTRSQQEGVAATSRINPILAPITTRFFRSEAKRGLWSPRGDGASEVGQLQCQRAKE